LDPVQVLVKWAYIAPSYMDGWMVMSIHKDVLIRSVKSSCKLDCLGFPLGTTILLSFMSKDVLGLLKSTNFVGGGLKLSILEWDHLCYHPKSWYPWSTNFGHPYDKTNYFHGLCDSASTNAPSSIGNPLWWSCGQTMTKLPRFQVSTTSRGVWPSSKWISQGFQ
jgi:hypothetical protein